MLGILRHNHGVNQWVSKNHIRTGLRRLIGEVYHIYFGKTTPVNMRLTRGQDPGLAIMDLVTIVLFGKDQKIDTSRTAVLAAVPFRPFSPDVLVATVLSRKPPRPKQCCRPPSRVFHTSQAYYSDYHDIRCGLGMSPSARRWRQ